MANTSAARTDFQIEVVEFASQRALISIPGAVGEERGTQSTTGINVGNASGAIVPITNIPITLEEALTERGVTLDGQYITRIALQRARRKYSFTLRDLLEPRRRVSIYRVAIALRSNVWDTNRTRCLFWVV